MRIQLIRYHDIGNINTRLADSLNKKQGVLPPLGLAYIAASLEKAGFEVEIIDAIAMELKPDQVRKKIRDFNPKIVGITAMTPTFPGALEAAKIAKEEGTITVMGGVHLSLFPHETLSFDWVDYGILGEGDESMVNLCQAVEQNLPVENIQGLAYTKNNTIHVNPAQIIDDLNKLPIPAFHLLPIDKYDSILGKDRVLTIMGSRGCPYLCSFCYKTPSDKKYRYRQANHIVDEMEHLMTHYGVEEIMFYDDLMPPRYVESLCREILERNIKIQWQTPQRVNLVRKPLLQLMAQAGCHMLRLGVEQGDPEMMKKIEKRTTIDQVRTVFKWTREAGIETFAYFMIGTIGETPKTMKSTIQLAIELDPDYVMFTKAIPLPNTPLMDEAVELGLVDKAYWRHFTLGEPVSPIQPLIPEADHYVKMAYRRFYLRPRYILRRLLEIRSWKSLRKNLDGFLGILHFRLAKSD